MALLSSGLVLPAILALLMATPSHDLRTVVHFAATLMIIAVLGWSRDMLNAAVTFALFFLFQPNLAKFDRCILMAS